MSGPITAAIESEDGKTTYASGRVSGVTQAWKQYDVTLSTASVTPTAKARFALTLDRPGTIWLGLVSLFPPTYKSQANGFRPDLLQMLIDMRPKFLRFPGGNYAVPADLQEPGERLPARPVPRGRSDRGPLRLEEDARAVAGAPATWRRGAIDRPMVSVYTSFCCGPRT